MLNRLFDKIKNSSLGIPFVLITLMTMINSYILHSSIVTNDSPIKLIAILTILICSFITIIFLIIIFVKSNFNKKNF